MSGSLIIQVKRVMLVKIVNLELLSLGTSGCITDRVIHYSHYNHVLISFSDSFTKTHQITILISDLFDKNKKDMFYTLCPFHPLFV